MDSKIRILDEHTANQIAAGEVIERPASVVKELVENAIDAGSTRIEIRLHEGGSERIQVTDNGVGMGREDCELAFARHATSKINDANDLFQINTLGFRGEALPSIAAVSKVQLVSRQQGSLEGTKICLEGGQVTALAAVGCPVGTDILVEKLFFNTPARKKYLKKQGTEASHAINAVRRLAIAYPKICFQLWHNDQLIFATGGSGKREDVLVDLYGLEYAEKMIPVHLSGSYLRIDGFVGKSFFHRSTREGQMFFVNGRYIRSPLLQRAVEAAYSSWLPSRRYPVAVLDITVPTGEIDVNVHPAKLEVKFARPEEIQASVKATLEQVLQRTTHIPLAGSSGKEDVPVKRIEKVREAVEAYLQTQWTVMPQSSPGFSDLAKFTPKVSQRAEEPVQELQEGAPMAPGSQLPKERPLRVFPDLVAIGQLHESYILAQGSDGLYVIDQHGAHERINYEKLQDKMSRAPVESQLLAIPYTLELNAVEQELLIAGIVALSELGIIIEHFGKNTFLIRAVPWGLSGDDAAELVMDLLRSGREQQLEADFKEAGLKMVACKQAVRFNKRLSLAEQQALLDELGQAAHPFTCPHGRPIIISYSLNELRRRFGRN